MLPSLLFGFLLSRRRKTQDPELGDDEKVYRAAGAANHVPGSHREDTRDRTEDAGGDLGIDDDTYLGENDIIRQVDREGADEYGERVASPEPQPEPTNLAGTSTERTRRLPWYHRLKAAVKRAFASDKPEDIIPTYRSLPIFSGILIPFSILLEIPGLTDHWYIRTENHRIVETRPNSRLLDLALGFSITCAVIANVCLIGRFMERRTKHMTWACAILLTVHDVINIIVVTTFGVAHRFDDGFTYGQAFWMTVCSTIASTLTNVTLFVDIYRTPNFSTSGSGLTRKQRALVIIIIVLLCYLALGALVNSRLLNLGFINALYFTVISIETIGFGDIIPSTTGARLFTCIYSIFGILNVGLAVGLTRETLLEALEVSSRLRVQSLRRRRHVTQWRRRVFLRWKNAISWRLREKGEPVWIRDKSEGSRRRWTRPWDTIRRRWPWLTANSILWKDHPERGIMCMDEQHPRGMHLNLDALSETEIRAAAMETAVDIRVLLPEGYWEERFGGEEGSRLGARVGAPPGVLDPQGRPDAPVTSTIVGRMAQVLGNFAMAVDKSLMDDERDWRLPSVQDNLTVDVRSLAQQYEAFRESMEREERHAFYTRLVFAWALFIMFWIVGSAVFMRTERWSFGIAMYFCFVSFTTIGYGDYSPRTPAGRSVFIVWALLGVGAMTILISILSEAYSSRYSHIIRSGVFDQVVRRYRAQIRQASLMSSAEKDCPVLDSPPPGQHVDTSGRKFSLSTSATLAASQDFGTSTEPRTKTRREVVEVVEETRRRTEERLAALPYKVLDQAREFHGDMRFFFHRDRDVGPVVRDGHEQGAGGGQPGFASEATGDGTAEVITDVEGPEGAKTMAFRDQRRMKKAEKSQQAQNARPIPESLDRLLNEITGVEGLSRRAKEEILEDNDARNTLLALSIEQALRRLIVVAEDALQALEERDALFKLQQETKEDQTRSQDDIEGENVDTQAVHPELKMQDGLRS